VSVEQRYRPNDECPLFSEALEEHIVAITRGQVPNRGTFCGNCYTPLSRESERCPHCSVATSDTAPVDTIPDEVILMLREQRGTESRIVNAFAYAAFIIVIFAGLGIVLGIPYLRQNHLIAATIVYTAILLVGGRTLAGVLGGYYGDHIAYDRARTRLRARWADWVRERGLRRARSAQ
jgi:hypothetical protein